MKGLILAAGVLLGLVMPAMADNEADYGPDWPVCQNLRGDPSAEIESCTRLIQSGKLTAQHLSWAYNDRAAALLRLKRPDLAYPDFMQAESADPTNASPYYNLGLMLNNARRFDDALAQWDKFIALKSNVAIAFCERGEALDALGRKDEALANFEEAVRNALDDACISAHLARAYREHGRLKDAITVLDHAIAVAPGQSVSYYERGLTYRAMHQNERALSDFGSAIEINPRDFPALLARGALNGDLGAFDAAIADLNTAVEIVPNDWEGYYRRAIVYIGHGDYQSSLDDCGKVLAFWPDNALCLALQWRANVILGNFDAARSNADALIATHLKQYRLYRGAEQYAAGDFASAAAEFGAYTQDTPDDAYGWLWLYLADRALGKDDAAGLKEHAPQGDTWPANLIRYALGASSANSVAASVDVPDPEVRRMRSAEAAFYMGELALAAGDKAKAAGLFEKVVKVGHAAVGPDQAESTYKIDDDLELALAIVALHAKNP